MKNTLSYRIGNFEKPNIPLDRVKALGVPCVEIGMGPGADAKEIKNVLAEHGLLAGSITSPCPITEDRLCDTFDNYCHKAATLGASAVFTSVNPGEMPLADAYERMRRLGDIAYKYGVKIGMETHPPLCENGSKAVKTMASINHPNVGINYDTANVYYYNQNVDTVEEVKKTASYVVSVHLKDTMGGYHDGAFPEFGKGIVDFTAVFNILNEVGFCGPFTMELEGKLTSSDDPVIQENHVRACVEHLRDLGLVG